MQRTRDRNFKQQAKWSETKRQPLMALKALVGLSVEERSECFHEVIADKLTELLPEIDPRMASFVGEYIAVWNDREIEVSSKLGLPI